MEVKKMSPSSFVSKYRTYARETENKTGIDSRFTLAQAALETGWGKYAPGNMFFGVKANPEIIPENRRQLLTTKEVLSHPYATFPQVISITPLSNGKYMYVVKDWFRKYATPEECFTDHANLFQRLDRYKEAMKVKEDPYRFAEEVAKAGYATDPNYASSLKAVIKTIERNL